ncbi:hypothetical protein JCM10212_002158 [Sporobolomyces blumeae]
MPRSSILHTVQVPAFDRETGQLSLVSHHLVSAPLGYSASFSPDHTLSFALPPAQPYAKSASEETEDQPRKKRRKAANSAEAATPVDWIVKRANDARNKTTTDRDSDAHHASIVLDLEAAVEAVRESWMSRRPDGAGWMGQLDDNIRWIARDNEPSSGLDFVELVATSASGDADTVRIDETSYLSVDDLANTPILNESNVDVSVPLKDRKGHRMPFSIVLPPSSGFVLSDFASWSNPSSGIASLGTDLGGWDVLIMDPPWPNTSATRSSSYETFDPYELWNLDVPSLLGHTKPVLVAVWLTNRVKYRRLLLDKLFPAWKIEDAVEWYWVKIASESGEPVWPLDSHHRRCYEGLIVGWYNPLKKTVPTLPGQKVFLSTPIGHSRKPVLLDLLAPYLPSWDSPPNVLELFARATLSASHVVEPPPSDPNKDDAKQTITLPLSRRGFFLAVGNEAIKFNLCATLGSDRKGWIASREENTEKQKTTRSKPASKNETGEASV